MAVLLGIDAGTTSVKACAFGPDGHVFGIAREEYRLQTPAPDRAELDPEVYWQACTRAVRGALHEVDRRAVTAVAVSSQGETTIAVDSDGRPLGPAIVWLDNRAIQEAEDLDAALGSRAYTVTGIPDVAPTWTAGKILWLRRHEPDLFGRSY